MQEQAQEQARVQEQVPEQVQVQVQVQVREQVQVRVQVRALVDACRLAPKQDRARAAVITPRRGNYAFDPGRSTSHRTMPATRRIRFTKS